MSQARGLHTHGETADRKDVDVEKIDGVGAHQVGEAREVFPLSGGNRDMGLLSQLGGRSEDHYE